MYAIELEKGVYIAPWTGDPPRTLVLDNAKTYKTKSEAYKDIAKALKYRNFKSLKIIELKKGSK